jgi:hypothetical protein
MAKKIFWTLALFFVLSSGAWAGEKFICYNADVVPSEPALKIEKILLAYNECLASSKGLPVFWKLNCIESRNDDLWHVFRNMVLAGTVVTIDDGKEKD